MSVTKKTASKGTAQPAENFQNGADAAAKGYERVAEMTREGIERASSMAFKGYEDVAGFNKEVTDAVVASSSALTRSIEDASKWLADYTKDSVEENLSTATRMFDAKSVQDVVEVQSDWAKSSFERFVAQSGRFQELSMQMASAAMTPFNAGASAAFEKFAKPNSR